MHADIFLWDECQKWGTNKIEWRIPHQLDNSEICCCISGLEAELGALFYNCQTGMIFWQTLANLSHPQPTTPINCNTATAVGIANNTVKHQQLRSMEMQYFWVGDKVAQDMYVLSWHPGLNNLADYQSNYYVGLHHIAVRQYYLHQENNLRILLCAIRPSTLKGCVGTNSMPVYVIKNLT
jgi:hypothetical protein